MTARTQSKQENRFSYLSEMQLERTLSAALPNKDQSHRNTKNERNNKQSIDTNRATALEHTAAKAVDMGDSNTIQVLMTDTSIPFITHSTVTCIRYYGSISTITQWIDNWNDWNDIRSLGYGGTWKYISLTMSSPLIVLLLKHQKGRNNYNTNPLDKHTPFIHIPTQGDQQQLYNNNRLKLPVLL